MAIASQSSPLSRWWGQPLEQISEFRLTFKPQTEQSDSDLPEPRQPVVVKGTPAQLESLSQLTESYVQNLLVQSVTPGALATLDRPAATLAEDDPAFPDDMPEWQADVGYSHRLYFGSLQVEPLMSELSVTTAQLHDLSEILQEALLAAQPQAVRAFPMRSPVWPKTAAAAVAAIGLTSGFAWYVTSGSFQTASESEQELVSLEPAQPTPPEIGVNLPPNFQVKPTPPQSPNSNTTSQALPKTRKPNVAVPTTPTPNSATTPSQAPASEPSKAETAKTTVPEATQPDAKVKPESPSKPKPPSKPKSESADQVVASAPKSVDVENDSPPATNDTIANSGTAASTLNDNSSSIVAAESTQPQALSETRERVATAPAQGPNQALPPSVSAPSVEGFTAKRAPTPPLISPATASEGVLTFFQSQWQGQDSLDQSLSYRIEVKPDGTVSTVTPRNNIASVQIEQTPVPPAGARLTPPFNSQNPMAFDVTLYPDGTVSVK